MNQISLKDFENSACIISYAKEKTSELCEGMYPEKTILIESKVDFERANNLCQAFGGNLFEPKNDFEAQDLGISIKHSEYCQNDQAYLGLKKTELDEIVNLNGSTVTFAPWKGQQPNGEELQTCIGLCDNGKYYDIECDSLHCFICKIKTKNTYKLRGRLPPDVDRFYFVGMTNNQTSIRGSHQTQCSLMESWHFGSGLVQDEKSTLLPPTGKKSWNNGTLLKFTQCKQNEFTCRKYGNCIPMEKRCDGFPDCGNQDSDENNCEIIQLQEGYNRKYSPKMIETVVNISLEITDIFDVRELAMDYKVRIKATLTWTDHRLTFKNLRSNPTENLLGMKEVDKIWTPEVVIRNSLDRTRIMAAKDKVWSLHVERKGKPIPNSYKEIDEDYLYPGSENTFHLIKFTKATLQCKFNLRMYPFDIQMCPILIAVPAHFNHQFDLKLVKPPKVVDESLLQYEFLNLEHTKTNISVEIIEIRLKLRRIFGYHLTSTYIPTLCLMIIAQLTLFIDPGHFEANIMVALTTMLVMYTLFQSVSANLPQTSYMKMIDAWLFCGLILPFFNICILILFDKWQDTHVITIKIGKKVKKWNSKTVFKVVQVLFPTINGLFCFIYWVFALSKYYTPPCNLE